MKTREELLNVADTAIAQDDRITSYTYTDPTWMIANSLRAIACILLAQERRKDEKRKPQANDALLAACEATDKALTDIQALMRQKDWKIKEASANVE